MSASPAASAQPSTVDVEKGGDLEKAQDAPAVDPKPQDAVVEWKDDPDNALNWSPRKKWGTVLIIALYTFVSPLASSMPAPGLPDIAVAYEITSPSTVALVLSIFLLASAVGPLFLAPLSEMYGRTWVLHLSNLFFLAFNVACAYAPTVGSLIAFRFLAGLGASAPLAIGGGTIGDLFSPRERASAMALYSIGPVLAPTVAPVAAGFIAETIGYKWIFLVLAIAAGVSSLIAIPFLEESFGPVIRERRAKRRGEAIEKRDLKMVLWVNLTRPLFLLTRSIICFVLNLYCALTYAYLYLLFTTFPTLFTEVYHMSTGISGLAFLGPGLGFVSATLGGAAIMNKIYFKLTARNHGVAKPEYRIPTILLGSVCVPIGLLWYGWSAQAQIHFIMPIIGATIFGAGMMLTFLPIQVYLVDVFTLYAASATASTTVLRSLFGFAFPLFGQDLFNAVGVGPGCSILAGISVPVGIFFPVILLVYGDKLRARSAALVTR